MLYSIKNVKELKRLEELDSSQNQVEEVRLKDKFRKQKYYYEAKKQQDSLIDTIKIPLKI